MKIKTKTILYVSVFLILVLFATVIFYYWFVMPSRLVRDAGEKIANGLSDAFNFSPRISIKNTVVFEEDAAILEVAVYSQRVVYDYDYCNTWMGSTKKLYLRGIYIAKYGFNFKEQHFSIHINEDDTQPEPVYNLIFAIPEPVLLSFETDNYRVIRDKAGWWNKFEETERENAINTMRELARIRAESIDYRNKVKNSFESQLKIMIEELPLDIQIGQMSFNWQHDNLKEKFEQGSTREYN